MLVKDQLTGEKIEKETAYAVSKMGSNGKKTTKYYTSEAAYKQWEINKEYRQKCIDTMYDILSYQSFMKIPTFFFRKLTEWEPYGFNVVLDCMNTNRKSIDWALSNKNFNGESAKVMYVCAILENHMNDSLKNIKQLSKIKEECNNDIIIENIDIIGNTKKKKDISNLLGDI